MLCYKYKTLSNGEHPIMVRICKDGKKKYVSVGISVKAKHWNFDKNEPKPNCPNREYIGLLIASKKIKRKYRLKVKNFSCHSLRKTFGRQVYNMNSENSELALVKLMELFNHSSLAITKRYLGLRQEEILETYDCLTF